MLFDLFRKKPARQTYDRENLRPVIRASICTGEQTAGFRHIQSGKFTEVMLIRDDSDLAEFMELYGISADEVKTEY